MAISVGFANFKQMSYSVYVLYAPASNRIYIGYSKNVEERLLSHNELAKKGWTVKFRPWTLVHTEAYETKQKAMQREKQLKSARGRDWIRKEILGQRVVG